MHRKLKIVKSDRTEKNLTVLNDWMLEIRYWEKLKMTLLYKLSNGMTGCAVNGDEDYRERLRLGVGGEKMSLIWGMLRLSAYEAPREL